MNNVTLSDAAARLKELDNIAVYTHAHPDGDALGSAWALAYALRKMGKRAKAVCLDTLPDYLSFIWNTDAPDFDEECIVTCDVASLSLLGEGFGDKRIALAIDHHKGNSLECDALLCMSNMAATGEIIFDLIKELGVEPDLYIAECLYTAIATDTGCFKFSNANEHTFSTIAELLKYSEKGNFGYLNTPLFITKSKNKLQFENAVISGIEYYFDCKMSVSTVTYDMLERFSVKDSETGGVEQLGKAIEGVLLAVTLKEREGGFKVSMRSDDSIDCSELCAEFGGGGHHSAAGCFIKKSRDQVLSDILAKVEEKGIL